MFQQVYSKGSGKVEAPCNTDCLSCHVTAMAEKIMYFFKERKLRKGECGRQQVLCHRRGERWTKFQPQETLAIPHRNVKNCSKVGKPNCVGHSNLRVQIKTTRKSLRVAKKVSFEPWGINDFVYQYGCRSIFDSVVVCFLRGCRHIGNNRQYSRSAFGSTYFIISCIFCFQWLIFVSPAKHSGHIGVTLSGVCLSFCPVVKLSW